MIPTSQLWHHLKGGYKKWGGSQQSWKNECHIIPIWKPPNEKNTQKFKRFLIIFRDDGIVFNISLIQFFIELSQSISMFIFFYFFPQKSIGLTRLVALLNITISTVIIPAFYFVGDCNFRRQIQVHGIRRAIMVAFLEK